MPLSDVILYSNWVAEKFKRRLNLPSEINIARGERNDGTALHTHTYTHTVEFRCQREGQACERINCRRGLVRQIRGDSVENLLDRSLTGDLVTVLVGVGE